MSKEANLYLAFQEFKRTKIWPESATVQQLNFNLTSYFYHVKASEAAAARFYLRPGLLLPSTSLSTRGHAQAEAATGNGYKNSLEKILLYQKWRRLPQPVWIFAKVRFGKHADAHPNGKCCQKPPIFRGNQRHWPCWQRYQKFDDKVSLNMVSTGWTTIEFVNDLESTRLQVKK